MREIIVTAYPKSGITWLLHLLCDLLEAPHQDAPQDEPLVYGHPVQPGTVVRKAHYPYWDQAIPYVMDKTVVFTQRDPRDVVVSAMYYRKVQPDLKGCIGQMIHSNYIGWLESWLNPDEPFKTKQLLMTKYENLHTHPIAELQYLIMNITGNCPASERVAQAIERQSFDNMLRQLGGDRHFMRKGIAGDWRNHFDRETAQMFSVHFGEFMLEQGYIEDLDWWQDV